MNTSMRYAGLRSFDQLFTRYDLPTYPPLLSTSGSPD